MILVDSSVVIDALRKPDPKLQGLFNTFQPAICGIVLAEVLHGARDAADYGKLVAALGLFPQVPMPGRSGKPWAPISGPSAAKGCPSHSKTSS